MKVELKGKVMPRNAQGDVRFTRLGGLMTQHEFTHDDKPGVLDVFGIGEVVELVNRALYQLEYQKESHRKRGMVERAKVKALKEAMRKQGKEPLRGE